jgi:hypothetical protein
MNIVLGHICAHVLRLNWANQSSIVLELSFTHSFFPDQHGQKIDQFESTKFLTTRDTCT